MKNAIRFLAMAVAVVLAVVMFSGLLRKVGVLTGGFADDAVMEEAKTYEVTGPVRSLEIRINAADLTIAYADTFCVKSNLKYLSVTEDDGVLTLKDEKKSTANYNGAILTVYIPAETVFDDVRISTGAAKLTAETLSAKTLQLQLGAGDVRIDRLNASEKAKIEGGAGKVTVLFGVLRDLDLEMGVGELELTAALHGKSELNFGVGQSDLTLIGRKEAYTVDIEKVIGSVTVDGQTVSEPGAIGTGDNYVDIEGGVGSIRVTFQDLVYA